MEVITKKWKSWNQYSFVWILKLSIFRFCFVRNGCTIYGGTQISAAIYLMFICLYYMFNVRLLLFLFEIAKVKNVVK